MEGRLEEFDSQVAAGQLAKAARTLQSAMPGESSDYANELQGLQFELGQLDRMPDRLRDVAWNQRRGRLAGHLVELGRLVKARLHARAEASATRAACEEPQRRPAPALTMASAAPSVFVSFCHRDVRAARSVAKALERAGLGVRIDAQVRSGQAFIQFIRDGLRETQCTLCLLSANSLQSEWVALETSIALTAGNWDIARPIVGGLLDDTIEEPDLATRIADLIACRKLEVGAQREALWKRGLDVDELNERQRRLDEWQASLGKIISHFRSTLRVDLRPRQRRRGIQALAEQLRTAVGSR